MKNKETIVGLIGVLLILTIVLGIIVVFNYDFTDGGEKPSDKVTQSTTAKPDVGTREDVYTFGKFYSGTNLGCVSNGDNTIFFIAMAAPDVVEGEGCGDTWSLKFDTSYKYIFSRIYDAMSRNPLKYSIDGGETWKSFSEDVETREYLMLDDAGKMIFVPNRQEIFVAFTEVANCSDVDAEFEAWLDDNFAELVPFETSCCGGNYNVYDTFKIDAFHKSTVNGGLG